MKEYISAIVKFFLILLLLSCANTSYSRLDEKAINDELVDIILGQFPHHGKAFYENEITVKEVKLKETPNDFELRNDIAVAYMKLEKWHKAEELFFENDRLFPGKYKTQSNLGVLYKKMGKFDKAASYIEKALEINPEGHMGLGDYYLKMIKWRQNFKEDQNTNFLGIAYENSKETAQKANRQYAITLIINDYKFIDAYLVLGDILFEEKKYQLAMRAYMRVLSLVPEDERYRSLYSIAKQKFQRTARQLIQNKSSFQVGNQLKGFAQIRQEITSAEEWLKIFQHTEADMIAANETVSFDKIREKMKSEGIQKPQIIEAVVFKGFAFDPVIFFVILIILPLVLYYIYDKRKRMRLAREGKAPQKAKHISFRLSR